MASARNRRRCVSVLALAVSTWTLIAVPSAAVDVVIDGAGAKVTEQAVRQVREVADVVSVSNSGALLSTTESAALAAARAANSDFAVAGSASIAMQRIRRGTAVVQSAPSTMSIPMATTVLDDDVVAVTMSTQVKDALSASTIVMAAETAALRGARAGDVVTLRSASGGEVDFTIGAVIDDEVVGGTELLMTWEAAARIALTQKSRVLLFGFESRTEVAEALEDNGLVSTRIRIRRTWDPPDPDSTLGMASTKALLGEFAYRVNSDGSVTQESSWQATNLPSGRVLLNSTVAIRARCHKVIEPALKAAFAEIVAAGLAGVFDVGDANSAGGCHNPRFSTLAPNSTIGFLSRHSWAMAIDTNTQGSCQGCAPPDFVTASGGCAAVRIMRKHGFAWGGNFLTPDGMHFEYVGERRDQLAYPSRYCPNIVDDNQLVKPGGPAIGQTLAEQSQRATFFADAGLITE